MPVWILRQPGQGAPLVRATMARGVSCRHAGGRPIRLRPLILMPALVAGRSRQEMSALRAFWRRLGVLKSGTPQSRLGRLSAMPPACLSAMPGRNFIARTSPGSRRHVPGCRPHLPMGAPARVEPGRPAEPRRISASLPPGKFRSCRRGCRPAHATRPPCWIRVVNPPRHLGNRVSPLARICAEYDSESIRRLGRMACFGHQLITFVLYRHP